MGRPHPVGGDRLNPPEPLSPQDATLLCATTPEVQLQIGALCRFEGAPLRGDDGALRVDDLRRHVESRLELIPRFRQRIVGVPSDLARPIWVDDEGFDLSRHVRVAEVPAPGGPAELRGFVAELLSRPIDAGHPLWDLWLLDGLDAGGPDAGDDVVVVLRVHHVVADGLSLLRAAIALLDFEPRAMPEDPRSPWSPSSVPGSLTLLGRGLTDRWRHQLSLAVDVTRGLLDPIGVVGAVRSVLGAVASPPRTAPRLDLTGRVGTRRDFVWTTVPLDPIVDLARSKGVTVNDVVLTMVARALRRSVGDVEADALRSRPPKVLVPVGDAVGGDGGNVFSFLVASLPVDDEDLDRTLDRIHSQMTERKASHQSDEVPVLFSAVDVVPVPLLRRIAPGVLARQPFVNLAVTNLPGSEAPLYLLGSRLRELQPIVTGVGNIACIIGVLSYCGELGVGITVDSDVVPDADGLLDAFVEASRELSSEPG